MAIADGPVEANGTIVAITITASRVIRPRKRMRSSSREFVAQGFDVAGHSPACAVLAVAGSGRGRYATASLGEGPGPGGGAVLDLIRRAVEVSTEAGADYADVR